MNSSSFIAGAPISWAEDFGRRWNEFWFRPSDPTLVSLLRVGTGVIALFHFASYGSDLPRWFAADGLLSMEAVAAVTGESATFRPTYLALTSNPTILWGILAASLAAAAGVTFGLLTRISCALTAVAALALVHRAPMISGQAEPVLVFMLIYLCIAPSGARFSLDSLISRLLRRQEPAFQQATTLSPLATVGLRLMQVHLAAFYLMMGLAKTYGDAWWDGTAVWLLLAQTHSRPLDLTFLRHREYLLNGWTHFIVFTQLGLPVLIWNRFTRPFLLMAAILVWLSLIPVTGLTSFCLLMLIATLCFLLPEYAALWLPARPPAAIPR